MNSLAIRILFISTFLFAFCYSKIEVVKDVEGKTDTPTDNPQVWSLFDIQNKLSEQIKEISELKEQLNNHKSTINNLNENPIPINFIYIQLSSQPEPKSLWPTVEWKDVTSEYSGLFFRAEGGNSEAFGTIQEDNAPRVTQVEKRDIDTTEQALTLKPNSWSEYLFTGTYESGSGIDNCHRYFTSGGEVRPRNTAIRIWKRTG